MTKAAIYVGAPTEESIDKLSNTILKILDARADQKTIRMALNVLNKGVAMVKNVSVSDCQISFNEADSEKEDYVLSSDDLTKDLDDHE